jgi:hypothetical protein
MCTVGDACLGGACQPGPSCPLFGTCDPVMQICL